LLDDYLINRATGASPFVSFPLPTPFAHTFLGSVSFPPLAESSVRENNGSVKNHAAERSDHEKRPAFPLPQNAAVKNSTLLYRSVLMKTTPS
jgi:hypothetical protein